MSVKISASFWKGTGMTRKDQFGKILLSCRYLLTRELSPDFLIAVLQLPHVPSRKSAHVPVSWWSLSSQFPG